MSDATYGTNDWGSKPASQGGKSRPTDVPDGAWRRHSEDHGW